MKAFDADQLFGGVCEEPRYQRKVAVVSTLETSQRAVILTNYNRPQREQEPGIRILTFLLTRMLTFVVDYRFERPQRVQDEFKIWEA